MVLPCKIGGIMNKNCTKCKEIKDISMFYKDNKSTTKIRSCCKKCDDILTERWRSKNRNKYLANLRKRWQENPIQKKANYIRSQKHRTEMSDMYIRSLMTKKSKTLIPKDIPDELVKIHREILKLKRFLKLTPKLKGEED